MAYDDGMAQRVRDAMATREDVQQRDVTERKMFGGLCFMVRGHMACGVGGGTDHIMVRVGKNAYAEALLHPHAHETSGNFRKMKGIVWIDPDGYESDDDLQTWIGRGIANAMSLPPK